VLLEKGIKTSQDLASHLLNVWNIATLPGSDFGELPEVLRLRLSTSSLYDSEASSPEEHELFLWQLLDQARALPVFAAITPKKWRDELGIEDGSLVKARKEGNKLIIKVQPRKLASYRVYSDAEIDEFLKDDELSEALFQKIQNKLSELSNS
jgi:bifunctional DNA-binding transcriptional regulator/antitoxin component of YhaV-PrlF toxin-antitoxin module